MRTCSKGASTASGVWNLETESGSTSAAKRRDDEGEADAAPPREDAALLSAPEDAGEPKGAASGGSRLRRGGVGAGVRDSPKE